MADTSPDRAEGIMSGDTEFTPTDEDVRSSWTAWSDPGDDRWTPERYDQWLADHDERVRAEAWDESAQEHRKGMVTTEWHKWPTNPYRRES